MHFQAANGVEGLGRTQNLFPYDARWRQKPQARLLQRGWGLLVVGHPLGKAEAVNHGTEPS